MKLIQYETMMSKYKKYKKLKQEEYMPMAAGEYIRKHDYFDHELMTTIPMILFWWECLGCWRPAWANGTREERDELFMKVARGEMRFEVLLALSQWHNAWFHWTMLYLEAPNPIMDVFYK